MKLPGFSAEASLYRTGGRYSQPVARSTVARPRVLPQAVPDWVLDFLFFVGEGDAIFGGGGGGGINQQPWCREICSIDYITCVQERCGDGRDANCSRRCMREQLDCLARCP